MLQAEFSANAEKVAPSQNEKPCHSREFQMALSVQCSSWHLSENERDFKNRKRFGWTDDDATAYWPHAAGAYRRIESANKGRGDERHARLERSESSRLGSHSLSGNMSNRRHLPRSLFPLHSQLDHQRAVQRSIKFAENAIIVLKITRWLSKGMCLKPCFQESSGKIQTANFSPVKNASRRR